ncbi:MAG: hypothetical protein HYT16_00410 [DPANN group archaeon]|nr:hypothetical protein [DPANN group archaeon]
MGTNRGYQRPPTNAVVQTVRQEFVGLGQLGDPLEEIVKGITDSSKGLPPPGAYAVPQTPVEDKFTELLKRGKVTL